MTSGGPSIVVGFASNALLELVQRKPPAAAHIKPARPPPPIDQRQLGGVRRLVPVRKRLGRVRSGLYRLGHKQRAARRRRSLAPIHELSQNFKTHSPPCSRSATSRHACPPALRTS